MKATIPDLQQGERKLKEISQGSGQIYKVVWAIVRSTDFVLRQMGSN
jgi:hypothetical protein